MYLDRNLKILRKNNPVLAEKILTVNEDSDYRVIETKNGKYTVKRGNILLHSLYDPNNDGEKWAKRHESVMDSEVVLCILGFGLGYHIESIVKRANKNEIIVFEPDIKILKLAFSLRDLSSVLNCITIIDNYNVPYLNKKYVILKHSPSIRFNEEYYSKIESRLYTLRVLNKALKISVVGPIYGGSLPVAEYTVKALVNLGHKVQYIDNSMFKDGFIFVNNLKVSKSIKGYLQKQFSELISNSVIARIEEFKPDLVLALAQAPLIKTDIEKMNSIGLKIAFWFVENYRHLTYWKEFFKYYDYIFVIQKGEFLKQIRKEYKKSIHYLPLAALPELHRPLELTEEEMEEFGSDISFVGAGYRNRRELFLGLLDYDFKIWGDEWDLSSPIGKLIQRNGERVTPKEIVKIFNASKINLNLHSSAVHNGIDPFGDFINPRTFEIAATKSFQLVDLRQPLAEFFEINKEIETFSSFDELRKKIDYYLRHSDEREQIAEAGFLRVSKEHTYELRLQEMLEFIFNNDFELPKWSCNDIFVEDMIKAAEGDIDLIKFLDDLDDKKGRINLADIIEYIQSGDGDLSDVEKIFLYINTAKEQHIKE